MGLVALLLPVHRPALRCCLRLHAATLLLLPSHVGGRSVFGASGTKRGKGVAKDSYSKTVRGRCCCLKPSFHDPGPSRATGALYRIH